jgi:hypothetical protein
MESFISPKSLMGSVLDQIKDSTSKNETSVGVNGSILMDSTTVLLSHQILPSKDYIYVYDSYPY